MQFLLQLINNSKQVCRVEIIELLLIYITVFVSTIKLCRITIYVIICAAIEFKKKILLRNKLKMKTAVLPVSYKKYDLNV